MPTIFESDQTHVCNTYARLPVVFKRGHGCLLWDDNGREYIDFVAGIAVCNLGHCHPDITRAICDQAGQLVHVSNLYYTEPQVKLAAELTRQSFADKVFFANSGAEANEAAIKIARKYSRERYGEGRHHIICMKKSFHGRTMATLSATGQKKVRQGFEPVMEGFSHVPFDCLDAVSAAITDQTCAVMLEPIQGEGGVILPSPGYLRELKEICRRRELLLIFDEIQVGMGRTGSLFAYQQEDVTPDVMTLAKALGNGLPIGAMLATNQVAEALGPGNHATTFGGTPLVTAAALRVLQLISTSAFLKTVRKTGNYFGQQLEKLVQRHAVVKAARGRGLIRALELDIPASKIVEQCLERGIVVNSVQEGVLRFVPPLVVRPAQIDILMKVLDEVLPY